MKNKKISHIGTLKNPISKSLKDVKSIPLTQIHNRSLSWIGTGTSIKSDGIKIVLWDQTQLILLGTPQQ